MNKIQVTTNEIFHDNYEEFLKGTKKGVIDLAIPVANILEWHKAPGLYSLATGVSQKEIEHVLYYSAYVISDPKNTGFEKGQIVLIKDLPQDGIVEAKSGIEGIQLLLNPSVMKGRFETARAREREIMAKIEETEDGKAPDELTEEQNEQLDRLHEELAKERSIMDAVYYVRNSKRLEIGQIHLFPNELRGILKQEANLRPYAMLQIQRLYHRVISRNTRLKKLIEADVPPIIIQNESRMLQEYVDTLIANGRRGKPVLDAKNGEVEYPYESLTDVVERAISYI